MFFSFSGHVFQGVPSHDVAADFFCSRNAIPTLGRSGSHARLVLYSSVHNQIQKLTWATVRRRKSLTAIATDGFAHVRALSTLCNVNGSASDHICLMIFCVSLFFLPLYLFI